jgi:predicted HTH domain antitoxin
MPKQVTLPDELTALLDEDVEREVLEATLLKLVLAGRASLGKAAELLGMTRFEAIKWYTGHGLPYPNLTEEELAHELAFARRFAEDDGVL